MLNFHKCLYTMYKYVLNSVVKISLMSTQYFEYYAIILSGAAFCGHAVEIFSEVNYHWPATQAYASERMRTVNFCITGYN